MKHISKRFAALLTASVLLFGCTEKIESAPIEESDPAVTTTETTTKSPFQVELPEINQEEAQLYTEAENSRLFGNLRVSTKRKGYAGNGYVTGFDKDESNQIMVNFFVTATQHYDITLCVAADKDVRNGIVVNSVSAGEFDLEGTGEFIRVTFHNIFLSEGTNTVSIHEIDGGLDLDYIELSNATEVYEISYDVSAKPVNAKASPNTKALMKTLSDLYGEAVITGQFAADETNQELELIHHITGQYPAIRCGDLGAYADDKQKDVAEIEAAIAWAGAGGIVSFMWYWLDPLNHSTVYAKNTEFSLKKAMTDTDIAELSLTELEALHEEGEISEECLAIVRDIDIISAQLNRLNEADIPVLWRPLHEAGGGWYWWGGDGAEAYQWLWELLYNRMTNYHKLNNLLWVWNGQSEAYAVDSKMYDIASIDVYLAAGEEYGSRSGQFQWLYALTDGKKLIALSECSGVPDVDALYRDNAVWSFFGMWYGNYIMNSDGTFSDSYTSEELLKKVYNSDGSVNLSDYVEICKKRLANE